MKINAYRLPTDTRDWTSMDWEYFAKQMAREYRTVVKELLKERPEAWRTLFPRLAEAERAGLL